MTYPVTPPPLDSGGDQRTCTRPRIAETVTDSGAVGASLGVRTAAALRAPSGGVADGAGVVGVAAAVAALIEGAGVAAGVIVLTAGELLGDGVTDGVAVEDAAADRNGGWLVPEFPLAARATAVTPTAATSAAPLIRPATRFPITGKRDTPAIRIRLDG